MFYEGSVIIVLPMHFSRLFQVKHIVRRVVEARKSGTPCFSYLSLLLSTTVFNDICDRVCENRSYLHIQLHTFKEP